MTTEQKRLFELLIEFDAMCKEQNIEYCLSGETLMYAISVQTMPPKASIASVLMDGDNCRAFIDGFEDRCPANREIEYWSNSANYPDYTIRYVASDTTAINMLDYLNYRTHGMCIEIQILRGDDRRRKSRSMRLLERGVWLGAIRTYNGRNSGKSRRDTISNMYYNSAKIIRGKKGVRNIMFDYFSQSCKEPVFSQAANDEVFSFCNEGRCIRNVPRSILGKCSGTCYVGGKELPIPDDPEALVIKMFGPNYSNIVNGRRMRSGRTIIGDDSLIIDANRAYADVIKSMGIKKEEMLNIYNLQQRVIDFERRKAKERELANKNWEIVLKTDAMLRKQEGAENNNQVDA